MLIRVLSSLVLVPAAVVLIFFPGGMPFAIAVGAFSVAGAMEFYGGARRTGARPVEWAGLAAVALFVVSARTLERETITSIFPAVLTLLLILSFCVEFLRKKRSPLENVGATVFGAIYVGWMTSHLVVLRNVSGPTEENMMTVFGLTYETGAWLVMYTFLCIWICDSSAYFIGKFHGKIKIAPNLSPNKTLEGTVGALICTIIASMIIGHFLGIPMVHTISLGVLFGILCQLGDLSESAIKRELAIKDFGSLIPGHGGVMDRIDSMIFASPAAYYYFAIFLKDWVS